MAKSNSLLIDPRGDQKRIRLTLAKRPSLEELQKGPIAFYNNTKLFHNNYMTIYDRTIENLAREGITNILDFVETPRGKNNQDLLDYAALIAKEKPVAAIVALGDIGVSPACTIITIELERLGIPTLYYTAPPGTDLVRAVANYRSGHICITSLDIYQGNSAKEVAAEIDAHWPEVMDALLLSDGEIEKRSNLHFSLDSDITGVSDIESLVNRLALSADDEGELAHGIEEINDLFNDLHINDDLPIIPPTPKRYKRMLQYCPYDPEMILAKEIGPSGKDILVKDIAIAAVMAGCKPHHMPILITAFKAMAHDNFNLLQSVTTFYPGGNLILVSGPLAQQVGLYGGQGCLGAGFPANLTVGRAINLAIINVCRSIPGISDLANISSQAEITYCFAEEQGISPWKMINEEHFDSKTTSVYVLKAEPPHDIIDFLSLTGKDLLDTIIGSSTTLGSNNAYITGPLMVLLTPDHAKLLARDGWSKDAIREHIHTHAVVSADKVKNRGIGTVRPESFKGRDPIPVTRFPRDIEIVVAGGRGGHSAIILPWALHSESIVEAVTLPDGGVPTSIEDFKQW